MVIPRHHAFHRVGIHQELSSVETIFVPCDSLSNCYFGTTKVRLPLSVLAAVGLVCEPGRLVFDPARLAFEPLQLQRCSATPAYVEHVCVVVMTVGALVEELESL